jgi:hypothetical protein
VGADPGEVFGTAAARKGKLGECEIRIVPTQHYGGRKVFPKVSQKRRGIRSEIHPLTRRF